MHSHHLHVIAVVSNPIRWRSRIELYKKFEQHMLDSGVRLTLVECAYGDRHFQLHEAHKNPHVNYVPVRAKSMVWNKESLINLGLQRLPDRWQYVAWLDADIEFRKANWAEETVHALQHYDIVQPWGDCYDLGPGDEHLQHHESFGKLWLEQRPIVQGPKSPGAPYTFAHPGYGWAATRGFIEAVGNLIDTAALGAADHHMAMATIGRVSDTVPRTMSPGYLRPLQLWQQRALRYADKNVGYVPGTIEHQWHGAKAARKYIDRWQILTKHEFDPDYDLKKNSHGVVELAGNKSRLRHDIDRYFSGRNEDSTTLG